MKKISQRYFLCFCLSLVIICQSNAQSVGIGTTNPNPSSILDLSSSNKGLLPPRMTFTQRNAIANPVPGLIVWCTDCGAGGELSIYNGSDWKVAVMTNTSVPDPCAGVTLSASSSISNVVPCSTIVNNGTVAISPSGGVGPYQINFNNGGFSTTSNYSGLAAGNYSVAVKDANGCVNTQTITVGTASSGSLFTSVKNIINSRCGGCHTGGGSSGGVSFATDCSIVNRASRIQARAVTQSNMPPSGPLPSNEKQAITNWINAGGQFNQ